MRQERLKIGEIPAILWGEPAEKGYLFVHGQGGSKEEAGAFSEIVCPGGWQVLGIDLPEHGDRVPETGAFDPWHAVPELRQAMNWATAQWNEIGLRANSIGAWFSMLAFAEEPPDRSLFVSPILDMERLIQKMMGWAGVTQEQLKQEQSIQTAFGQTLSWPYLIYAQTHPITAWESVTSILYAEEDNLTERCVVDAFVQRFNCRLTVMEDGEHWFHTPAQLDALAQWTRENF